MLGLAVVPGSVVNRGLHISVNHRKVLLRQLHQRLRAENAESRMERDVLKRSVGQVGERGDEVSLAHFIADQRTKYQSQVPLSGVVSGGGEGGGFGVLV